MTLARQPKWALVGPGAIGLYYSALLIKSGSSLAILARSDLAEMRENGILLRLLQYSGEEADTLVLNSEFNLMPEQITADANEIGFVDYVLIASKSTVNQNIIGSLGPLVKEGHTALITLQNGLGNAEFFAQYFPRNPVLSGLCFVCVNRTAPAVVENYLTGRVEIGSLQDLWPECAAAVVDAFNSAGIRTKLAKSMSAALWRKLCWNIPFNGLSIVCGGITTDRILKDPSYRARAARLMQEVRSVSTKAGYLISDDFIQSQFDVTESMGAYKPSSLIDFLSGRSVEVEAIWGEPLRCGKAMGIDMFELQDLYECLKKIV